MELLKWIEQIRNPVFDVLFSLVTRLGEESLFIGVALLFLWCIDKRRGYFLIFSGGIGLVVSQFLKIIIRRPRPFAADPTFSIVESAREKAAGFSFPSSHSQNAVSVYGGVAHTSKRRWLKITGWCVAALICFSRLYLGVHYPSDVAGGAVIGAVTLFLLEPLVRKHWQEPKIMVYPLVGLALLALANLLYVLFYSFPAGTDAEVLATTEKYAWQFLFIVFAMIAVYFTDTFRVRFSTEAVWWAQILKFAIGFAVIMGIRYLSKAPLNALCGEGIGSGIRYFAIILFAGIVWPLTFPLFAKLGKKE